MEDTQTDPKYVRTLARVDSIELTLSRGRFPTIRCLFRWGSSGQGLPDFVIDVKYVRRLFGVFGAGEDMSLSSLRGRECWLLHKRPGGIGSLIAGLDPLLPEDGERFVFADWQAELRARRSASEGKSE